MAFQKFLLALFLAAASEGCTAQEINKTNRLILAQGGAELAVYFDGNYRELKRASEFYGFGWLDDHRVFVAFQSEETVAALAEIEIIDLHDARSSKLMMIGGVGETNFDINQSLGQVVYSDAEGVKVIQVEQDNTYHTRIIWDEECWGTFWIDKNNIGCLEYVTDKILGFVMLTKVHDYKWTVKRINQTKINE